jgi:hypothetical protein
MRRYRRKNPGPANVPLTDALLLIGIGTIVGGLAYFFYTKNQESSDTGTSAALPTGTDSSGNPTSATAPSGATGGVGVFSNTQPGGLGPTA